MSDPQQPHGLQPSRLLYPWDFPGKSTGVGCHCLLHGEGLLDTMYPCNSELLCWMWTLQSVDIRCILILRALSALAECAVQGAEHQNITGLDRNVRS